MSTVSVIAHLYLAAECWILQIVAAAHHMGALGSRHWRLGRGAKEVAQILPLA